MRIYADVPVSVDVQAVKNAMADVAKAAGCANPRTEMVWRGRGDDAVELLVWCPEPLKEAPRDEETATPRANQPSLP